MTIGQRIYLLRCERGWGQERLAAEAHVAKSSVYEIEAGRVKKPKAATVHLLAMALGIPVARLLGLEEIGASPTEAAALDLVRESACSAAEAPLPQGGVHVEEG